MLELNVTLRKAQVSDLGNMLALRNHPAASASFYSQKDGHKIKWNEHVAWFNNRPSDWLTFIIELDGKPVGTLTFGSTASWCADIGIVVQPEFWGKGIAKRAIKLGLEQIPNRWVQATILNDNVRSVRLFQSMGFEKIGPARPGEGLYRLAR